MSKDAALVVKLKDCLQDAVVFLRTLGDFRIPAVMERRRKELLDRLIDTQGDTRREKPPKFEEGPAETPPVQKKVKQVVEKEETSSESSSTVTSPRGTLTKRDSKIVNTLVKDYEVIHTAAKKEEVDQTPKRMFELKKTAKPSDFPDLEKDSKDVTPQPPEPPQPTQPTEPSTTDTTPPVVLREKFDDANELKPERPTSAASVDSVDEPGNVTPKHKRKAGNKLGFFKRKHRDKSPRRDSSPPASVLVEPEASDGVESESVEVVEEGVRISGKLEHKTKSALKTTKYVSKDVKLKETTLFIGDKENVSMLGCTVAATDTGFELFSHPLQKQFAFKVGEGEQGKEKWINVLNEAIAECAPEEEPLDTPSTEPVPTITVEEPVAPNEPANEQPSPAKKRKESKVLEPKSEKALPKHGVEIQGNIHRKKPGIGTRWEKTYCVVTYEAIYFTTIEDRGEYNFMLNVVPDGTTSVSEKAKGHDKHSKTIVIKSGRKTEHLSIETKDGEFDRWNEAIQRVYCVGGVEELGSDEEEGSIEEDLYEDVGAPPPIPGSPRPSHPALPEVPVEDDFIIDEDIYEDTDDLNLPGYPSPRSSSPYTAPSLPDRNPPKVDNTPQPKLPPRNAPTAPQPQLPPRNAPTLPPRVDLPKSVAPIPTVAAEDDEIYDDIVPAADEETYDDVVVAPDAIEEDTYDDVVVGAEPITEEYYEEMVPGMVDGPQEDYVVMEHGPDDGDDLYVDVDHEPPPPKIQVVSPPVETAKPIKSGTFSRKSKVTPPLLLMSGSVSYRGPKKSKFEEKHATVGDTSLLVYKTSTDKKHQEKIPLSECGLELGSTETGAGEFAFRISKGSKVHHFSVKSKTEQEEWVGVLAKLVKYAPVKVNHGEQQVYETSQDHIAEADGELTFKKGSFIRLISKETESMWLGQIGNEAQVFDGKTGKFPSDKVVLVEDLYI